MQGEFVNWVQELGTVPEYMYVCMYICIRRMYAYVWVYTEHDWVEYEYNSS